jgi:hypothetical protein
MIWMRPHGLAGGRSHVGVLSPPSDQMPASP